MKYAESPLPDGKGFVICLWKMQSLSDRKLSLDNIIVTDACIDLVVEFDKREIGFAGMSKTEFHFKTDLPSRSFGARMMPGAFNQLTGLPASTVMDTFLPLSQVWDDFDRDSFFDRAFEKAEEYFKVYLVEKCHGREPDTFTALFNTLACGTPGTHGTPGTSCTPGTASECKR